MTVDQPERSPGDDDQRRLQDQLDLAQRANDDRLTWDATRDRPDHPYLFDPDFVLLRDADLGRLREAIGALQDVFAGLGDVERSPIDGLTRYLLPRRRDGSVRDLEGDLNLIEGVVADDDVVITPDHYLHLAGGAGAVCPASEPEETGLTKPRPRWSKNKKGGDGVRVAVVDSGWHPPAETHAATPWLVGVTGDDEGNDPNDLREYAGHGTFVAGVVRCLAPATQVHVDGFLIKGGTVLESLMVEQLVDAVARDPHVINLSAGARTRRDRPLLSFEVFYETIFSRRETEMVLVAAAGNDGVPDPFWPASFDWALGVGSLDRDGMVSEFSNHGDSADVYALGRNHINAFPKEKFVCKESPNKGDVRRFKTGLARWSGTSFSAPVVAGQIAVRMSAHNEDAPTARNNVLAQATAVTDPRVGAIKVLPHQPLP